MKGCGAWIGKTSIPHMVKWTSCILLYDWSKSPAAEWRVLVKMEEFWWIEFWRKCVTVVADHVLWVRVLNCSATCLEGCKQPFFQINTEGITGCLIIGICCNVSSYTFPNLQHVTSYFWRKRQWRGSHMKYRVSQSTQSHAPRDKQQSSCMRNIT
jgi:hypothetical protein